MTVYTVKEGDSLYSIGKKYGVTIEQLLKANGSTVNGTLIIGQAVVIPEPVSERGEKFINGYTYPAIDRGSLTAVLPYLTAVSPFNYGVREDGTLLPIADTDIITIAQSEDVRPILIVTTLTEEGIFNSQRAVDVLENENIENTLILSIKSKLEERDYLGVDIDFEYVPPENKAEYANFISRLREEISPLGYKTFVSVAPKTSSDQRGLLYEAHDYSLLGAAADYVLVMTYEWGYTYGPPMAIAPIDKVRQVLEYAVSVIPKEKILMGVPNYAYDWVRPYVQGTRAESMSNTEAVNRARRVGAQIMFDSQAMTPYYTYYENGRDHIVWFEDARSVKARMELINELSIAGLSVWNITSFYQPLWSTVNSYFKPIKY